MKVFFPIVNNVLLIGIFALVFKRSGIFDIVFLNIPDKPRENFIGWDEYFMAVAFLARQRSKDPKYQVGACIVNDHKQIVGIGYNGMPTGCIDENMHWGKDDASPLNTKFFYVCHAESNAIMFRTSSDVRGCTMYVTLCPCNECAKVIIQSGIRKVIYFTDEKAHKNEFIAAKKIFDEVKKSRNFEYEEYTGKRDTIMLRFSTANLSNSD